MITGRLSCCRAARTVTLVLVVLSRGVAGPVSLRLDSVFSDYARPTASGTSVDARAAVSLQQLQEMMEQTAGGQSTNCRGGRGPAIRQQVQIA